MMNDNKVSMINELCTIKYEQWTMNVEQWKWINNQWTINDEQLIRINDQWIIKNEW